MIGKIAMLGCGLIGESWTGLMIAHGASVRLHDPGLADPPAALDRILAIARRVRPDAQPSVPTICPTLAEALQGCDLVQENVSERLPMKQALFAEVERLAPPHAIIASSTSSFVWSELTARMDAPERLVTAHPFNPPHLMPLVEIFGSDPDTVQRAAAFYAGLGRSPVILNREARGHIANRLSSALWREAVNIVAEGIADVDAVDRALVDGPGLRWSVVGAHMGYHLGGGEGGIRHYLEHLGPSQEQRWASLGDPRLTADVCEALVAGVEAEARGRSIDDLAAERDHRLEQVLAVRGSRP